MQWTQEGKGTFKRVSFFIREGVHRVNGLISPWEYQRAKIISDQRGLEYDQGLI